MLVTDVSVFFFFFFLFGKHSVLHSCGNFVPLASSFSSGHYGRGGGEEEEEEAFFPSF